MRQPCTQTLVFEWLQRVVTFKLTTEGVWFSREEVAVTVKPGSWEAGSEAGRSLHPEAAALLQGSVGPRSILPPVPMRLPTRFIYVHTQPAGVHSPFLACPALALPSSLCG